MKNALWSFSVLLLLFFLPYQNSGAETFNKAFILVSQDASDVEIRVAELLASRLQELPGITARIETGKKEIKQEELLILLGIPEHHPGILRQFEAYRLEPLTWLNPGKEGFLLQKLTINGQPAIMAAGIDQRGCLYAVGELLRQINYTGHAFSFPENLYVRTAPAFEIRGTEYGQSGVARNVAKVRDWTEEETQRVIIDYALAGANVFTTWPGRRFEAYEFIKSYGLMTQGNYGANTAGTAVPEEWEASESIGRLGYVCLSVPDAVEFMLEKAERDFKNLPPFDIIRFYGGDGGGCECDNCRPYGHVFIQTVEKMAEIVHKYHPDTRIYFTNQKFDNEGDIKIFEYLNEKPREWLWAWGYGPGSDATTWQPGHRQNHRMDLFRYPGFGPYGLYPKEILRQMPARHSLLYFNEITHWRYAQHAYIQMYPRADRNGDLPPHWSHEIYERRPDQYLTMVYDRVTFFAWPRFYHRVFNDLMPYGIGDITHSSGHHDHFNQWMWQRLLWSPRMKTEEAVDEYSRTWFGEEAASFMAKAIFQLEENLPELPDTPITEKEGIDRYYELVKEAGRRMPAHKMENDWLWRLYMQKGALDKYIKLAVIQQKALLTQIEEELSSALAEVRVSDHTIATVHSWIEELSETEQMIRLREEAGRLGEESNRIFGLRNDGYFNLLDRDFVGLGWLKRQLDRSLASSGEKRRQHLKMITDYENPGEGGFYDNLGTFNPAPNVVQGYPYDHGQPFVRNMLSEGNRSSQKSMHFTQDEDQGVTLHYRDLDPEAEYKIRFTFVRPWFQDRYAHRMNQTNQSIYVNGQLLVKNVELPLRMSDFFTFDIPREITGQGELVIHLERGDDVARGDRVEVEQWRNSGGWGTIVSEAWLIRKNGN